MSTIHCNDTHLKRTIIISKFKEENDLFDDLVA